MAAIRVAIIGLSSGSATSWASSAHLPYLLSERGRSKYRIVALCNSSLQSAKAAVTAYKLPAETRTYGDPKALAEDSEVDLVVCATRVDLHFETIAPSVKAGKAVYVEWPLAESIERVRELVELAKQNPGSSSRPLEQRTIIGLQGRQAHIVLHLRQVLESGRIGKVLNSELRLSGGTNSRDTLPTGLAYFAERKVGGNVFTIGFAHVFDFVQSILGEAQDVQARFQLQRPVVKLRDTSKNTIVATTVSDVPDLIVVSAALPASDVVQNGATILTRFRRGQPFPGEPAISWTIVGDRGEIRVTGAGGTSLHAEGYSPPPKVELYDFETDQVEEVQWQWADWQEELPIVARSVGALYEAYAASDWEKVPTFTDALRRHEQLCDMLSSWSA